MTHKKRYLTKGLFALIIAFTLLLSACGNDGPDKEAIKSKVEAYNNAQSYTMDFKVSTKENNESYEVVNKVNGTNEYIRFDGQSDLFNNAEFYQQYREGIMVRYFINEDGLWDIVVHQTDEIHTSFLSPDNIKFEWFSEGDGGYLVLSRDHYKDMFGEANEQAINIATIRDTEEGLEIYYSYEKAGMTLQYTAIVHSVNETTVDLPEVQATDE